MGTGTDTLLPLSGGTLTLDAGAASGSILADQLARLTAGKPITVANATRSVAGGTVTVTGTAGLLGLDALPVTVIATSGAAGTTLAARFALPTTWRFSQSFPNLPLFSASVAGMDPTDGDLLDRLALSDAGFVLTTAGGSDPATGVPLQAGFNFVAQCDVSALLGPLGKDLKSGATLPLGGPVILPAPNATTPALPGFPQQFPWQMTDVPGIYLTAGLAIDWTVGEKLRLHDVALRFYSPPSQDWAGANPSYMPLFVAETVLDVPSAGISLDLTVWMPSALDGLMLSGRCAGVSIGHLAALADLAGGTGLADALPADVQQAIAALESLALEAVMLRLGPDLAPTAIDAAVTLGVSTGVVPGFSVGNLSADFALAQPFAATRSLEAGLRGTLSFLDTAFGVQVALPDGTAMAEMDEAATLPLGKLFAELGLPAPPDLTVDSLTLGIGKDGSWSIDATMADAPGWTLALGPASLTVADVSIALARAAGAAASGSVGGTLAFDDTLKLDLQYQLPGNFTLRADLPEARLSQLLAKLVPGAPLPKGFDIDFTDGVVLIGESGSDLTFQFATTMASLGTVIFEATRASSGWGFAAIVDLGAGVTASSLPGLGALVNFEKIFRLDELLLVAASIDDPAFQLPDLAAFQSPSLASVGKLSLPAQAGGLTSGFSIYGRWTIDTTAQPQKLLKTLLDLDPALDIALEIGADPALNSRLSVGVDATIAQMPASCSFGGAIQSGEIELFLTGQLTAQIQGHPVEFSLSTLFLPNGIVIAGSMQGTVAFEGLELSDLALVIGCDWEAIPSLGIAATLTHADFQAALAFFFDSADPSHSMLAGAISNLTLRDVVDTFVGRFVPSAVDGVLGHVALEGTGSFTLDAGLADALDGFKLDAIAAAFDKAGVSLPQTAAQLLLVTGKSGESWFITDMTQLLHYELRRAGNGIAVSLNPQFRLVPQTTTLGSLRFEQGCFINAMIDVYGVKAMAKVTVTANQGIAVDAELSRIVIGSEQLFCLDAASGGGGPSLSLATFKQPTLAAPLDDPHALINGQLTLLGLSSRTYVDVTEQGFSFTLDGQAGPDFHYALKGDFHGLDDLRAGGDVTLSMKVGTVDLGALGSVDCGQEKFGVAATLSAGLAQATLFARVTASTTIKGQKLSLPPLDLDVGTQTLLSLPALLRPLIAEAFKGALKDAQHWAELIGDDIVVGVDDVGAACRNVYGLSAKDAATAMQTAKMSARGIAADLDSAYHTDAHATAAILEGLHYDANTVGDAVQHQWQLSAGQVASALQGAGYSVEEAGTYVKNTFNLDADKLKDVLEGAGFPDSQINGFFNSLGGDFKNLADQAWNKLKHL